MRPANRGDFVSVAGRREPVVDGGANAPAPDRRIAGAGVAGDQQNDPLAVNHGLLERPVDRLPRPVEVVAVKIDHPVKLD